MSRKRSPMERALDASIAAANRQRATGPGRRCAFCKRIGGTGFRAAMLESLGGEPGNRSAHAPCLSRAQLQAKEAAR